MHVLLNFTPSHVEQLYFHFSISGEIFFTTEYELNFNIKNFTEPIKLP